MATVCIVGGGIVGSATAYFLVNPPGGVAAPKKVTVIDECGVAAGASGKSGGFLAEDWHGTETSDLARLSMNLHAELAERHNGADRWGYRRISVLSLSLSSPGPNKARPIPSELSAWLDASLVASISTLGTPMTCAQVHPRLLTNALVSLSQVEVVQDHVEKIAWIDDSDPSKGVVGLITSSGTTIPCTAVALAAGPWLGGLASSLLPPQLSRSISSIGGSRVHSIVIRPPRQLSPHALFTSLRLNGKNSEPEVYPRPDGTAYICGAGDDANLPETAAEVQVDSSRILALKEQIAALSPNVLAATDAQVEAEQSCYLPVNDRGGAVVGKVCEGVYVGGGLSCWGITLGPGIGKCMAELILEGKVKSADISYLSP